MYNSTITRQKLQSSVFKLLFAEDYNFEQGTILASSQCNTTTLFDVGTIMGQITVAGATAAAKSGGNTGGGSLTVDSSTPVLAGAVAGIYTVLLTVAAAVIGTHLGLWEVRAPNGRVLGEVQVGQTFSDQIKFATAYATADFIVGDGFDVTVAAGSLKYVQHAPAAVDGSQNAAAVVARAVTVGAADISVALAVRGPLVLLGDNLTWATGISAADKATATAALAGLGIVIRSS